MVDARPGGDGRSVEAGPPPDGPPADTTMPSQVMPYGQCQPADPPAKFIDEQAPPAALSASAKLGVWVRFANCSNATWSAATSAGAPTGHKLGAQGVQDNIFWGSGRHPLPGDVPHDAMVRVSFSITAPDTPGQYPYQWAIVDEGVAWLKNQMSPLHTIDVQASVKTVQLCAGVSVEIGGIAPAAAAIQQCIDKTPTGGLLELPAGVYRMEAPVVIERQMTVRTSNTASSTVGCLQPGGPPCAVLRADASLAADNGFFQIVAPASQVTVRHLVLDGNRSARLGSTAAATCASGNNRKGFNAFARGDGHDFSYNASINALCGTAMEWRGHDATIVGNLFSANGDHATLNLWADGLTIHEANSSKVQGNAFRDNSDIDLILGGGTNTVVSGNSVVHTTQATFGGLMLDNFNGGSSGDFTGTEVTANQINCGALLCDFGINLGPHAWYLSENIRGGHVHGNTVVNGKICLNIDGAGTAQQPIKVHDNNLSGSPSSATFNCGTRATSNYNIGADSVVDKAGDPTPHTTYTWHQCP